MENADAVIRKDDIFCTIEKIDKVKYHFSSVVSVFNKTGMGKTPIYIPYKKSDRLSDIKVALYDETGKKIKTFSKSDFSDYANNSQGTFYSDDRVLVLNYDVIQYPYTIDFSYQYETNNTVFLPDFVPFRNTNIALEESKFVINNPSGIELRTKIYPSKFNLGNVVESTENGAKVYTYKNIEAIQDVDYLPLPEKILPKVSFSLTKFNLEGKQGTLSSWDDFGKWYFNDLLLPVSKSTPQIKAEITSLNLKGSAREKTMKIFQYMQEKTRYISVALGIGGWQPMQPDEVQKKGYGDCKALTNYMKTLLDEAGIQSYYSVINSSASPVSFDPDFPKMGGNHVVLMIPTEEGNIWLENTSQQIAFNHLGNSTTNRNVLAIKEKGIEIIATPTYKAQQNKEIQKLRIYVLPDTGISGSGSINFTGSQYDNNLQLTAYSEDQKKDYLKDALGIQNFEKLVIKNLSNNKNDAILSYDLDFKVNNYSKNAGNSLMFRSVPFFSSRILKNDENRKTPFELTQSFEDHYEIEYTLPASYKLDEKPEDIQIKSEFGNYSLTVRRDGENIKVQRILMINNGLYPKEKYNDYINFRKKIQNFDNSKILITTT